jgi:hypothetical protein
LGRAYQECYANNPRLLELAKKWEKAGIEGWLNCERNKGKSTAAKNLKKRNDRKVD